MRWKNRYLAAYQRANGRSAVLVSSGAGRFRVEDSEGLGTGIAYTQAELESMTVRLQQRPASPPLSESRQGKL